jgi:hypothetical protein
MLHDDYAPCHIAISMNEVLTKKGTPMVVQPLYLPDLSLCDFFLFPKLKFHLEVQHFGTVNIMQKVVTDQLGAIPDFQHCYWKWERLRQCVASKDNYFEGDDVDFYFS